MLKYLLLALMLWAVPASAQNQLQIGVLNNNFASYLRGPSTLIDARVLAANVSEAHTIPSLSRYVIFSATCASFYAKFAATAAVPAADVTDGTASELNPSGYLVPSGVTQLALIAPATCVVTLAWYL